LAVRLLPYRWDLEIKGFSLKYFHDSLLRGAAPTSSYRTVYGSHGSLTDTWLRASALRVSIHCDGGGWCDLSPLGGSHNFGTFAIATLLAARKQRRLIGTSKRRLPLRRLAGVGEKSLLTQRRRRQFTIASLPSGAVQTQILRSPFGPLPLAAEDDEGDRHLATFSGRVNTVHTPGRAERREDPAFG